MTTRALADGTEARTSPSTARPLLLGALAALSVGAAAIHFAVIFEHFDEYSLYGVFFLVLAWAQLVWPAVLVALALAARRVAAWLWLGIAGNAIVLVIYFSSRSIGLPVGPDTKTVEAWGGLDLVCAAEEILLVVIAAAVLARPGLLARPVRFRSQARSLAGPACGARCCHRRDRRGYDARVGRLGGPGRNGLRLVELDDELVRLPAGRHG